MYFYFYVLTTIKHKISSEIFFSDLNYKFFKQIYTFNVQRVCHDGSLYFNYFGQLIDSRSFPSEPAFKKYWCIQEFTPYREFCGHVNIAISTGQNIE